MKIYIPVLAFTVLLSACRGNGHTAAETDSSIVHKADSLKTLMDSAAVRIDSGIRAAADTVESKINQAVDSARRAIKK